MAKPYSSSHIGMVASSFTSMRLSGQLKQQLVKLLTQEITPIVPEMESATLEATPEKKTLDDATRTRLNYNRTRELMIQEISKVESVGSEAVQACVAHLESLLEKIIHSAEKQAELDRVNTIKPRHLEAAIGSQVDENTSDNDVSSQVEEDVLDAHVKGSALTPNAIRGIAKSFAGMPITDDAVEELLLLYYDVVDETEENIRKHAQLGSNPAAFIQSIDQMRELMMLGWMRRMLKRASHEARERGYKRIDVEQLVLLDPFE